MVHSNPMSVAEDFYPSLHHVNGMTICWLIVPSIVFPNKIPLWCRIPICLLLLMPKCLIIDDAYTAHAFQFFVMMKKVGVFLTSSIFT